MAADAKYFVQAILDVKTRGGGAAGASKASKFANSLVRSGEKIRQMGPSIGKAFFGVRSALAAAGGAYGIGRLIQGAINANREIENINFSLATTLQLFGRHEGETGQFALNMQDAAAATDKLFRIAATSPASFQQANELFRNLLPGIAQVEDSMENTLDFTKKALAVGTLLGGDFQQAGADLRRILTGQAGGDVRAWAEGLSEATRRAAGEMGGDFKKLANLTGANLTQAFNKLDPQGRYKLMQEALKDMGVATEAAGDTWDGLTSAIKSDFFLLNKAFGSALFEGMRSRFRDLVGEGGIANPLSESFGKLELAAKVAGTYLADVIGRVFDKFVKGLEYVADHWEEIYIKLAKAFNTALKAAKMMAAARVTAMAGGAALGAAGKGIKGAQGLMGFVRGFFIDGTWDKASGRFRQSSGQFVSGAGNAALHIKRVASAFGGVGAAALVLLPVILLLGSALAGVAVAFGGIVAWFVENWNVLIDGIRNGTVQLQPLMNALGTLWAKMVALGEAIIGESGAAGATGALNKVLLIAAEAVHWLIGAFAFFLRAAGWVQVAWNAITAGIKLIATAFLAVIEGILSGVRAVLEKFGLDRWVSQIDGAINSLSDAGTNLYASAEQDAEDARTAKFFELADAFEAAYDKDGNYAKSLENATKKALTEGVLSGKDGKGGGALSPAKNVNIHNMRVEMDLRNKDPDRIMGAFVRKLERVTNNPTQAMTQEDYGV